MMFCRLFLQVRKFSSVSHNKSNIVSKKNIIFEKDNLVNELKIIDKNIEQLKLLEIDNRKKLIEYTNIKAKLLDKLNNLSKIHNFWI